MKKLVFIFCLLISSVSYADESISGEFLKCSLGPYGSNISFKVIKNEDGSKHLTIDTYIADHLNYGSANGSRVSINTYSNHDKQTQLGIADVQQVGNMWIMYGDDKKHTKFSIILTGTIIKVDSIDSRILGVMIDALQSTQIDKSTQIECSTLNQ